MNLNGGVFFVLLKFAIQDFLDEKELQNLSKHTLHSYKAFFREYKRWLYEKEIVDVDDITPKIIKSYLLYCKNERGNAAPTVNTKLKHLKAFFNHLQDNEFLLKNPIIKISKMKEDTQIEVFTDAHIRKMLAYYRRTKGKDKQFLAFRNSCIITTLLGTGIRIGELLNLQWSDIDTENYLMTIYGKNRRQETVPLTSKVLQELLEYKLFCERHFGTLSNFVFVKYNNTQLTYDSIKNMFMKLQEVMNFTDVRLSAHTFRHTFSHRFLMSGGDVFTLQKILRHKNLSMTEKYLALWGTALHEQNEKYNPLNDFDL